MSIKISSLVWEHYPAGGSELLTALAYADHAHDDGTSIRPSVAYIARKTRQSERSVRRYLSQMRESGWLQIVRYGNGGRGFATEYRVNPLWITNPAKLAPLINSQGETLTDKDQNPDNRCIETLPPMSAQPSIIIKEPMISQEAFYPPSFEEAFRTDLKKANSLIQQCPNDYRLMIMNEITTRITAGQVKKPLGLLRKYVQLASEGKFKPTATRKITADTEISKKTHMHYLDFKEAFNKINRLRK